MANVVRKRASTREAFLVLLFIAICVYFVSRAVFLVFAEYGYFEKILATLFFLSEAFLMFHAAGYFFNIYNMNKRELIRKRTDVKIPVLTTTPSVAIFIPARHEPQEILEDTVASCFNLDYPAKTIYILDDSSDPIHKAQAEQIAEKYGAKIFRREERHGAKAGVINDCLKTVSDQYIAVFDVDQNPMPNFLKTLLPLLEADPKLALVQTPQFYTNAQENRISFAAQMQQAVFYEYICEGKSADEAMICCGTNVVIRREALVSVGGFDETTVTEDFATSFQLHQKKWKTLYYNRVNTFGMAPTDLPSYFQQQSRWATGNVKVFGKILQAFFKQPGALKPIQWFDYLVSGSYYFIGWAYLFLMLCPVLFIFFNVPSFFMNPVVYTLAFLPYVTISIAMFYLTMGERGYELKHMFKAQTLNFLTLPILVQSAWAGLSGAKTAFKITPKVGKGRISYFDLWPQLLIWGVNLCALTWGLNRLYYERNGAILINILWISYHFILFSGIFFYNEEED